jgi:hypothetical protein
MNNIPPIQSNGQNMKVNPTRLALEEKIKELDETIKHAQRRIDDLKMVLDLFPHPYNLSQSMEIPDQISVFAGLPESQQPRGGLI